jgi:hypothetical protein
MPFLYPNGKATPNWLAGPGGGTFNFAAATYNSGHGYDVGSGAYGAASFSGGADYAVNVPDGGGAGTTNITTVADNGGNGISFEVQEQTVINAKEKTYTETVTPKITVFVSDQTLNNIASNIGNFVVHVGDAIGAGLEDVAQFAWTEADNFGVWLWHAFTVGDAVKAPAIGGHSTPTQVPLTNAALAFLKETEVHHTI